MYVKADKDLEYFKVLDALDIASRRMASASSGADHRPDARARNRPSRDSPKAVINPLDLSGVEESANGE